MSRTSAASSATSDPSRREPAPLPPGCQLLFAQAAPLALGQSVSHTWGMEALLANPDAPLPADVAALQELVRQLLAEVRRLREGDAQLCQDNEQLRHRLDQALRLHFGQRSERSRPRRARVPRDQAGRDEATSRPGHGRQPLPEHLPRERVEYDLAEADKLCPCCGGARVCIGEQVSEQLDYRPASYFVVQHAKKTYACPSCEGPSERRFATAGPAV